MHSYSKKLKTQPLLQWEHDELRQHVPNSFQTRYTAFSFLKTIEFLILFTRTSKTGVLDIFFCLCFPNMLSYMYYL